MQDERVGRLIRAVRIKRGWRQSDLGARAGCSQRWVAQMELGRFDSVTIGALRKVGDALEIRLTIDAWWRRGDGAHLLDAVHAGLVEHVLRSLSQAGWTVRPEWSFNNFGERGSVDIIAWHEGTRTLLLIEVKSRIDDVQELLHTFGRKVRIAPDALARERGWVAARVATMLVATDSHGARNVVGRHVTTFDAIWPERTATCKAFIRHPAADSMPFHGGIWFVAPAAAASARSAPMVRPQRIHERANVRLSRFAPSEATPRPVRDGPVRDGPARDGPARGGPVRDGPVRDGPVRDGPVLDGSGPPST